MKNLGFFIVFVVFCSSVSFPQSTWQIVNPPANEDFVSVCFTDEAHGWIISESGTIVWTADSGITWSQFSFSSYHFESVHFSDMNHGCIVGKQVMIGDSSLILVTSDGGENWTSGNYVKVNTLNDVFFINNDKGWAVGSRDSYNMNCVLHTLDGGNNWAIQESILVVSAELFSVHFRDENNGQVCGNDGAFFLTNNGGGTGWALGISMPLVNLNAICNFGTLAGCMVGDGGKLLYTINNWYQYIEQNSNTVENLNGVSGYDETNEVWVVGDNGTIIYTSNYLLGWITQASGVTENLNDVCMINNNNGWAVGDNGTILQFTNPSSINDNFSSQIEVFPNPVREVLSIKTNDPSSIEEIEMYSMDGKRIYQRNSNFVLVCEIDVSSFLPGIYYLRVMGQSNSIIEKIVIE